MAAIPRGRMALAVGTRLGSYEILEQAVDAGFIQYPMIAEHDLFLAKLRGSERFERLLVRAKREWQDLEV